MHVTNPERESSLRIAEMVIKQTPKLGYHRIIVACGKCLRSFLYCKILAARNPIQTLHNKIFLSFTSFSFLLPSTNMSQLVEHCRRRKVRCRVDEHDEHGRCENCLRLERSCNFFRKPQAFPSTTKRRIRPSIFDGIPLKRHSPNPVFVPDSQPLKAASVEETCELTETLYSGINAGTSISQNEPHYFKDRTNSVTSSSQAIRKTSSGSMLGSPSSLKSHEHGQERAQMVDFERLFSAGNLAFHSLDPQKPLDPAQYATCHCTNCFRLPQPEAWEKDIRRSSSNPQHITNIQSSRPDFLEMPEPTPCSEGSLNGSCSIVCSTSWNMLSTSSSFSNRQAKDTVVYGCENRFSAASSRTTICTRWPIPEA